jgi:isopentenyl-diphosphate delta-isomerase
MEQVILVSEKDQPIGTMEKMEAHRKGVLHRAFSVFIFDRHGKMLLQQRALHKYHSGGLWSNACCSHPRPGEDTLSAAKKRLKEEMGFETELRSLFSFAYKAEFENGLIEHEYDHVLAGHYDGKVLPNKNEVMNYRFESMDQIKSELEQNPEQFTAWFRLVVHNVSPHIR